jgi:hypothetical protein
MGNRTCSGHETNEEGEQVVARQPAISFSISFQQPFNRAGGRTSNVPKIPLKMQITGEQLQTLFDAGISDWQLERWLVDNGQRIEGPTSIAILESSEATVELEAYDAGFLRREITAGSEITRETTIASILKPEDLVPLDFALKRIYGGDPYDSDLMMSAVTLCEHADQIDNRHLLHCLDLGGSIAAWGARGLYAKTLRDGIDRFTASESFSTDREGWEEFLRGNEIGEIATGHPPTPPRVGD